MKDSAGREGERSSSAEPLVDRKTLDELYDALNKRGLVHPDPLEFLYEYDDASDREVVGLIASSLAYGRVKQILASVRNALDRMGPSPASFLVDSSGPELERAFDGFKHRFTTGEELARMLGGVREVISRHGTLGEFFASLMADDDETVLPALTRFVAEITGTTGGACPLPAPERGSACKRLHLFLRWMVRRDEVDPGGWDHVSPSKLIVPLDTHMHRLSRIIGLTERKQADVRTALEITKGFRMLNPEDPVKYDFALTRLGIRDDVDADALLLERVRARAA